VSGTPHLREVEVASALCSAVGCDSLWRLLLSLFVAGGPLQLVSN
jgi:hypothetical protein